MQGFLMSAPFRKRLQYFLAAGTIACVGYIFANHALRSRPIPFDADVWREQYLSKEYGFVRFRMAKDLQRSHLRPGMARREVESLLGPGRVAEPPQPNELRYELREAFTEDLENEWRDELVIALDSSGRIVEYGVERTE